MRLNNGEELRDKSGLLLLLHKDWLKHDGEGTRNQSFIYRQLKEDKDKKADLIAEQPEEYVRAYENRKEKTAGTPSGGKTERLGQYELIEAVCVAYRRGEISEEKAFDLLRRIFQAQSRKAVTMAQAINEIAACRESEAEERNEKIRQLFSERSVLQDYKEKLVKELVDNYFQPYGLTGKDSRSLEKQQTRSGIHSRQAYRDDIFLLDRYLKHIGNGQVTEGRKPGAMGQELWIKASPYQEQCESLYEKLNRLESGVRELLIPLGFDPGTGCGIFIIGRNRIDRYSVEQFYGDYHIYPNCYFAVIYYVEDMTEIDNKIREEGKYLPGEMSFRMQAELFPTLAAAIESIEENLTDFYDSYDRDNMDLHVWQKLPEKLQGFFDHRKQIPLDAPMTEEEAEIINEYVEREKKREIAGREGTAGENTRKEGREKKRAGKKEKI